MPPVSDRSPSAATAAPASLQAPAVAGQGVDTHRNRAAWLSIAEFLTRADLHGVLRQRAAAGAAGGKRSDAAAPAAARVSALPDGNHGENHPATVTTGNGLELQP